MHIELIKALLPQIKQRQREGDCPTTPALPTEQLENMVLTLAHMAGLDAYGPQTDRERQRQKTESDPDLDTEAR